MTQTEKPDQNADFSYRIESSKDNKFALLEISSPTEITIGDLIIMLKIIAAKIEVQAPEKIRKMTEAP